MDQNAKQLAVERIKNSANILVTVSNNPEVDDLSALIGFTLLLSKLNKHSSAVFSGQVPPAIEFLQPNARLEKDVSSLRDFIIALDKDKADKLRYKVEDNVVRIFITPYKSKISQADLTFSEGDFNVDTVVALGVSKRDDLDNAIKAHGRILHDAAVVTVNSGSNSSDLGSINWQDPAASSLCEMLVSVSESFGSGLLDEQISTAFLTGIVAATKRFSNGKTTPKVMTMAAQLMAAGANQQLISTNLQVTPVSKQPAKPQEEDTSQLSIDHGEDQDQSSSGGTVDLPVPKPEPQAQPKPPAPSQERPAPQTPAQTSENPAQPVSQQPATKPEEPKQQPPVPKPEEPEAAETEPKKKKDAPPDKSIKQLEEEIAQIASSSESKKKQLLPDKPDQPKQPGPEQMNQNNQTSSDKKIGQSKGRGPREVDDDPMMGGTFNATSQQAHEDNVSDIKKEVNSTLLSHPGKPLDEKEAPEEDRPTSRGKDVQPPTMSQLPPRESETAKQQIAEAPQSPEPAKQPKQQDSSEELNVNEARQAVEEAMNSQSFNPANNPLESINARPVETGDDSSSSQEISIDASGNLQQPGQTAQPPPGDTNQEFKLPGQS